MAKYQVYGILGASIILGEYEAESEDKAIEMAEDDSEADFSPLLCHHCAGEVEISDVYEIKADKID